MRIVSKRFYLKRLGPVNLDDRMLGIEPSSFGLGSEEHRAVPLLTLCAGRAGGGGGGFSDLR